MTSLNCNAASITRKRQHWRHLRCQDPKYETDLVFVAPYPSPTSDILPVSSGVQWPLTLPVSVSGCWQTLRSRRPEEGRHRPQQEGRRADWWWGESMSICVLLFFKRLLRLGELECPRKAICRAVQAYWQIIYNTNIEPDIYSTIICKT